MKTHCESTVADDSDRHQWAGGRAGLKVSQVKGLRPLQCSFQEGRKNCRSLLSKRQQRDITQQSTGGGILELVCGERKRDGGRRML